MMTSSPGRISARIAAISNAPVHEWGQQRLLTACAPFQPTLAPFGEAAVPGQLISGVGLGNIGKLLAAEIGLIERDRLHFRALIWVERPGQKAIVIGRQGESLKAAAWQARLRMQMLFGCPVHLEVWVKVRKRWSSDAAALASLGYTDR